MPLITKKGVFLLKSVDTLVTLFEQAEKTGDYAKDFTYKNGGNAFVLFPKDVALSSHCIKVAMNPKIKNDVLQEKEKLLREVLSSMIADEGSVQEDIQVWNHLQHYNHLQMFVPEIYAVGENYLVMEWVKGESVELETLDQPKDENEKQLQHIYQAFTSEGFILLDNLGGIYDEKRNRVILIDIGSFTHTSDLTKK